LLDFVLSVFRYLFLFILYYFIFQLIRMIFRDLRAAEQPGVLPSRTAAAITAGEPLHRENVRDPRAGAGLTVLSSSDPGLQPGSVFSMGPEEEIGIGRSSRSAITMEDPFASLDHAAVYQSGGQYWLADRGSRNGTFLNEVRIKKPTVLAPGDRIRIGGVTLQFVRWTYEVESGNGSGPGQEAE